MEKQNLTNEETQLTYYEPSVPCEQVWNASNYILNKIIADQFADPQDKMDAIRTLIKVTEDYLNVANCMDNFIDEDDADIRKRALPRF